MARSRWYALPSGLPYHGPPPPGAVLIDPPSAEPVEAGEEGVDAGDSGPEVDAVSLVDEQPSETEQVDAGPAEGDVAVEAGDSDREVVRDGGKATPRRSSKKGDGEGS